MIAALAVEVQVALISTAGLVVVAALAAIPGVLAKRSAKRVETAVGEPDGQGNAIQMLERILAGQAGQDNRIARLEGGHNSLRSDVDQLTGRVDVLERRTP